jgi:hypothetical protein
MNVVKTGGSKDDKAAILKKHLVLRPSQRTVSTVPWQTCCLPER